MHAAGHGHPQSPLPCVGVLVLLAAFIPGAQPWDVAFDLNEQRKRSNSNRLCLQVVSCLLVVVSSRFVCIRKTACTADPSLGARPSTSLS